YFERLVFTDSSALPCPALPPTRSLSPPCQSLILQQRLPGNAEKMASHGVGGAEAVAQADPKLLEASADHGRTFHYFPSNTGSVATSWPAQAAECQITPNGSYSNLSYQYNPQKEMQSTNVQDGASASSVSYVPPTSEITSQAYPTNSTYSASASSYSYSNSGYSGYYNGYQPQPTQSYSQTTVGYQSQNTGAPYQPISSFQNTGSYAGTPSYSSTYYNPGHYQTYGGYTENGYSSQNNLWNQGNFPNYREQNATYGQDSGSAYSSNAVAPPVVNYQPQQYKQWADYYSQTEVTCAPGTENKTVTSTSTLTCPIPGVSSGYTPAACEPQPSYIPAWKPDTVSSTSAVQTSAAVGNHDSYWHQGSQSYPNQANYQMPPSANSSFARAPESQLSAGPMSHLPSFHGANQVNAINHQPLQPLQSTDTRRVSKLQIPTNPRIASNLSLGVTKSEATSASVKPAYVSVSLSNPSEKMVSSHGSESSDTTLKPGVFPASLRGYVERALARCKGEKQMAASQEIMKEVSRSAADIITKATADGTLHSRNWDMEPLFPLPDPANESLGEGTVTSLPNLKRSPNRRTKSRWEPMPEEKLADNTTSTSHNSMKFAGWTHFNGRDKKFAGVKFESKESKNGKFSFYEPAAHSKSAQRPFKRQRFGKHKSESGDASSDSDQEKASIAINSGKKSLISSPEEWKKRQNRSKRFEKANGQKGEQIYNNRAQAAGTGNLYSKRTTALVLNKAFEDNSPRAVEDMDWDALTVRGTCQEIEKRYLRLTSAPDPATVRPEEVLEKALLMVLNSQKSYLYKCDQLKSIRQDLTVQRIRNQLTAKVYETHARLALEYGDLPEFNQCQSQLKFLYGEGIAGCYMEFSAYSLLSVILHSNNKRELLSSMARLSAEARRDEAVKHALAVRQAVNSGNYVLFFRLYKSAPNLNTFLMDLYVEKMRFQAVQCMSRAYRPTVPVSHIANALGFSSLPTVDAGEERVADGLEECIEWLKAHGACLNSENDGDLQLDSKASSSSLFMPEPEDAVAHGDANLAVDDFFTRAST
ncbi:hypothetical protein V2J09_013699, partial [Rumex salicifolius]